MTGLAPPLKAGRGGHGLTPEQVLAAQRTRMLRATVEVAAARGYAAMTVADVIGLARVSRRTFYEQFADKEDCFLAAVEDIGVRLTGRMAGAATDAGGPWLDGVRAMVDRYLRDLAADPPTAQVLLLELLGAGPRALAHRARVNAAFSDTFAALYAAARAEDPRLPDLPAVAFVAATGGFDQVLTERVRLGHLDDLHDLTGLAVYLARALVAGHDAAAADLPSTDPIGAPPA